MATVRSSPPDKEPSRSHTPESPSIKKQTTALGRKVTPFVTKSEQHLKDAWKRVSDLFAKYIGQYSKTKVSPAIALASAQEAAASAKKGTQTFISTLWSKLNLKTAVDYMVHPDPAYYDQQKAVFEKLTGNDAGWESIVKITTDAIIKDLPTNLTQEGKEKGKFFQIIFQPIINDPEMMRPMIELIVMESINTIGNDPSASSTTQEVGSLVFSRVMNILGDHLPKLEKVGESPDGDQKIRSVVKTESDLIERLIRHNDHDTFVISSVKTRIQHILTYDPEKKRMGMLPPLFLDLYQDYKFMEAAKASLNQKSPEDLKAIQEVTQLFMDMLKAWAIDKKDQPIVELKEVLPPGPAKVMEQMLKGMALQGPAFEQWWKMVTPILEDTAAVFLTPYLSPESDLTGAKTPQEHMNAQISKLLAKMKERFEEIKTFQNATPAEQHAMLAEKIKTYGDLPYHEKMTVRQHVEYLQHHLTDPQALEAAEKDLFIHLVIQKGAENLIRFALPMEQLLGIAEFKKYTPAKQQEMIRFLIEPRLNETYKSGQTYGAYLDSIASMPVQERDKAREELFKHLVDRSPPQLAFRLLLPTSTTSEQKEQIWNQLLAVVTDYLRKVHSSYAYIQVAGKEAGVMLQSKPKVKEVATLLKEKVKRYIQTEVPKRIEAFKGKISSPELLHHLGDDTLPNHSTAADTTPWTTQFIPEVQALVAKHPALTDAAAKLFIPDAQMNGAELTTAKLVDETINQTVDIMLTQLLTKMPALANDSKFLVKGAVGIMQVVLNHLKGMPYTPVGIDENTFENRHLFCKAVASRMLTSVFPQGPASVPVHPDLQEKVWNGLQGRLEEVLNKQIEEIEDPEKRYTNAFTFIAKQQGQLIEKMAKAGMEIPARPSTKDTDSPQVRLANGAAYLAGLYIQSLGLEETEKKEDEKTVHAEKSPGLMGNVKHFTHAAAHAVVQKTAKAAASHLIPAISSGLLRLFETKSFGFVARKLIWDTLVGLETKQFEKKETEDTPELFKHMMLDLLKEAHIAPPPFMDAISKKAVDALDITAVDLAIKVLTPATVPGSGARVGEVPRAA